MTMWNRLAPHHRPVMIRPAQGSFIIFVDPIFTIFIERAFTNVFDVIAEINAAACLWRAGNAD
jgi:hypothetical protein